VTRTRGTRIRKAKSAESHDPSEANRILENPRHAGFMHISTVLGPLCQKLGLFERDRHKLGTEERDGGSVPVHLLLYETRKPPGTIGGVSGAGATCTGMF